MVEILAAVLGLLLVPVVIVVVIVLCFLVIWGAVDIYAMMRLRKNNQIDKTAIMGNWLSLKWMFASQTDLMVEKLPFLRQDLSEVLGIKEDDGETT